MYKLTIDAGTVSVSNHRDRDGAESELLRQARAGDYYLRPLQADSNSTTYQLLQLPDIDATATAPNRCPRSAGQAVIEKLPTKPAAANARSSRRRGVSLAGPELRTPRLRD